MSEMKSPRWKIAFNDFTESLDVSVFQLWFSLGLTACCGPLWRLHTSLVVLCLFCRQTGRWIYLADMQGCFAVIILCGVCRGLFGLGCVWSESRSRAVLVHMLRSGICSERDFIDWASWETQKRKEKISCLSPKGVSWPFSLYCILVMSLTV